MHNYLFCLFPTTTRRLQRNEVLPRAKKEKLDSLLRVMIDSCPAWMACVDLDGNYLIADNYYKETFKIPLS